MRLEDHVDAVEPALARRREGGANLGGMVAVVVDHAHTGGAAAKLESAIYPAELGQAFADSGRIDVKSHAHGHSSGGVEDVVNAGHPQVKFSERFSTILDGESRSKLARGCCSRSSAVIQRGIGAAGMIESDAKVGVLAQS